MNKKGLSPIEMSININGRRVFMNLPRKEDPLKFSEQYLADYLAAVRTSINNAITDLTVRGITVTPETLREYIRWGGIKEYTLEMVWAEFFKESRNVTAGTIRKYELVRDSFSRFQRPVKSITKGEVIRWINNDLQALKTSTMIGYVTKIKTLLQYAVDNGWAPSNVASTIHIKKEKTAIECLSSGEFTSLLACKLGCERLEKIRDSFLFSCYSGLSYADLKLLNKEDVQYYGDIAVINKPRKKTGVEFNSVVLPEGVAILKKYNGEIPVVTNQVMNRYLQEIQTLAGIKQRLHFHLARKVYATGLLNAGVRIEVVAKALGHSNTLVTQRVYAEMKKETVMNEVRRLL